VRACQTSLGDRHSLTPASRPRSSTHSRPLARRRSTSKITTAPTSLSPRYTTPTATMADADIEANIDLLLSFGADQLDRNEARQLLANHGQSVEAAMDKYFTSMEQGGIQSLKTHLRNSQAKWDETAFAGAGYGIDDTNVPTARFSIQY